ncbi:hypothetical protein KA005_77340 [bacterium]|nr:hypothetical protein [bacterium]
MAVLLAVVTALFYRSKAKYESTVRKASEEARKTEQRSTNAMVEGLEREAKAREDVQKRIAEFARGKRP